MSTWNKLVGFLQNLAEPSPQMGEIHRSVLGAPTLFDGLYGLTGKPFFLAAADFIRPTEADVAMSTAPLGVIGSVGRKVGAKAADKLFKEAIIKIQQPGAVAHYTTELRGLLKDTFKMPRVIVPAEEYFAASAKGLPVFGQTVDSTVSNPLRVLQEFIDTLAAVPEQALRGLRKAELVLRQPAGQPRTMASYFPKAKTIKVYPAGSDDTPLSVAHEVAEFIADRAGREWYSPNDYQRIIDFLQGSAGWNLKKARIPFSSDLRVPASYDELASLFYKKGWPEKPLPRESWEDLLKSWGSYFLYHPTEDLAESIAYSFLRQMPEYSARYATQIQALEANPRKAVGRLLKQLGVFN